MSSTASEKFIQVMTGQSDLNNRNGKAPEIEGNTVRNKLLLNLPSPESDALFPQFTFVPIRSGQVLEESQERIKYAYFVNTGVASVLNAKTDGKTIEVGMFGKEGCTAWPLAVGLKTGMAKIICQVEGTAFRISTQVLVNALRQCKVLERRMQQYGQIIAMQCSQVAACNSVHDVNERLARWLLMSRDRVEKDVIPLTHEFLAHMLGTRRASVTIAAGQLQKSGLITYNRGSVKIENRERLEDATCECYRMIKTNIDIWKKEAASP